MKEKNGKRKKPLADSLLKKRGKDRSYREKRGRLLKPPTEKGRKSQEVKKRISEKEENPSKLIKKKKWGR